MIHLLKVNQGLYSLQLKYLPKTWQLKITAYMSEVFETLCSGVHPIVT